jgi:hypothetical protein
MVLRCQFVSFSHFGVQREAIMADQSSRGGKKQGGQADQGRRDQQQTVRQDPGKEGQEGVPQRPPVGQPGGPKESRQ